tara:strand:- start:1045 stop:1593 length:549 start_codon:yes stop_codon:yes gene_type:complete
MTDIKQPDWDNAPEDATHCEFFGRFGFWIKDWDVATGEHSFLNTSGLWMLGTYASNRALTKRPTKSPVYTQVMCDAGEPPLVGMECEIINCGNNHKGVIKYISTSYVIVKLVGLNHEQHFHAKGLKFRPIDTRTDKEKAREAAINELVKVLSNSYTDTTDIVNADGNFNHYAEALVKAGYSK